MIAMQYSFTFPADYDMQIIRDRIASKAAAFDGFPGLIFKAFLYAGKAAAPVNSSDNLYAPFYLWEDAGAMNRFLASPGFIALTQAFGWPQIKIWSVWGHDLCKNIKNARYASREIAHIAPHTPLSALQESEQAWVRSAMKNPSALAVVSAFEPTSWTAVRFHLWHSLEEASSAQDAQRYEAGYVATGER